MLGFFAGGACAAACPASASQDQQATTRRLIIKFNLPTLHHTTALSAAPQGRTAGSAAGRRAVPRGLAGRCHHEGARREEKAAHRHRGRHPAPSLTPRVLGRKCPDLSESSPAVTRPQAYSVPRMNSCALASSAFSLQLRKFLPRRGQGSAQFRLGSSGIISLFGEEDEQRVGLKASGVRSCLRGRLNRGTRGGALVAKLRRCAWLSLRSDPAYPVETHSPSEVGMSRCCQSRQRANSHSARCTATWPRTRDRASLRGMLVCGRLASVP